MATAIHIEKDPSETLIVGWDWTAFLEGASIVSSTWAPDAGLTEVSDDTSGSQTTVTISGGTAGNYYRLSNAITTSTGEIITRSFIITVEEL